MPPATDGVAPDVVAPDCPVPDPPVGVPNKDEALAKAKQMFADWGYDVSSYQFDERLRRSMGRQCRRFARARGPEDAPHAVRRIRRERYGHLRIRLPRRPAARGADYPTIGAAAGLERLKTQNQFVGGMDGTGVLKATDVAA